MMSARGVGIVAVACASLALRACGDNASGDARPSKAPPNASRRRSMFAPKARANSPSTCATTARWPRSTARCAKLLVAEVRQRFRRRRATAGAEPEPLARSRARQLRHHRSRGARRTPTQQTLPRSRIPRPRARRPQNAVQEVGGYTFQRMELVDATPVTAEIAAAWAASTSAPIERNIRFPRIDGAADAGDPPLQRARRAAAAIPACRTPPTKTSITRSPMPAPR